MPQLTEQKRSQLQRQFKALDISHDGRLSKEELAVLLRKGNPSISDAKITLLFDAADKNHDGTIDFDEFVTFVYQDSKPSDDGTEGDWEAVRATFTSYCGRDGHMQQVKLCKMFDDCKCFGGGFTKVQSDIIFDKVKAKGERHIGFEQFKDAVRLAAAAKKVNTGDMMQKLANSSGPKLHGTATDNVRFHDDKSSYTGTHTTDGRHGGSAGSGERHHSDAGPSDDGTEGDWEAVRATFTSYCGRDGHMQAAKFCKMFDDCKCFGGGFTKVQSDLIFAKVGKGGREIFFEQFKDGVRLAAAAKKVSTGDMMQKLANSSGPKLHGTTADIVPLHDDKSNYTGTHATDGRHGVEHHPQADHSTDVKQASEWGEDDWGPVDATYEKFAKEGMMDSKDFMKCVLDCKLTGKDFPKEHVDTVFAKVAGRLRKVGPDQFQDMLRIVAEKKKVPVCEVQRAVAASEGPHVHATHAEAVRFHDDKTTYTGMHHTDGRH